MDALQVFQFFIQSFPCNMLQVNVRCKTGIWVQRLYRINIDASKARPNVNVIVSVVIIGVYINERRRIIKVRNSLSILKIIKILCERKTRQFREKMSCPKFLLDTV